VLRRYAFTMIELIFVIVVIGFLAKFGTEFLAQAYNGFIFSKINNELQSKSESAVEQIAARLQYRIKTSIIGRDPNNNNFKSLPNITVADSKKYTILEWIGIDNEGFRGTVTTALWSGIIDIDKSTATYLVSPETNTSECNELIKILSYASGTDINSSAIYFIGSTTDINGYGWDGNAITTQSLTMHPIQTDADPTHLIPRKGGTLNSANTFSGEDVYEYYQLAWSAYAIGIDDYNTTTKMGTLKLWYDYQPWDGETYKNSAKSVTLMENVSTFRYNGIGSLLKIQVCTKSTFGTMGEGNYSICKEKTVY